MRYFFMIFNALLFILFAVLFGFSLYHNEGAGFFLLPMLLFLLICVGLSKRSRLTLVPVILILIAATVMTFFTVVGNIAWPESLIMKIILMYLIFSLAEMVLIVFLIFFMKKEAKVKGEV